MCAPVNRPAEKPVSSGEAADEAASRTSEKETNLYAVKEPQGSGNPINGTSICAARHSQFQLPENVARAGLRALLEEDLPGPAFDAIFSLQRRRPARLRRRCLCAINIRW